MIANYIFGFLTLISGLFLFLLSFNFYTPKFRSEESRDRFNIKFLKYRTIIKIFSIAWILYGGYSLLIKDSSSMYIGNQKSFRKWTLEDKQNLINRCMIDAQISAVNYPEITKEYCECSMSRIIDSLSYDEYQESLKKSQKDQMDLIMPIIKDCLNEYKFRLDSTNLIRSKMFKNK
jgi:hypothetical protein